MKRLSVLGLIGALATLLAGCPIYDDKGGDYGSYGGCADNGGPCMGGGPATSSGNPGGTCSDPSGCGANETCGQDGQCHPGDCTFWGCAAGYRCAIDANHGASCVPGTGSGGAGQGGSGLAGQGGAAQGGGGHGGGALGGAGHGGGAGAQGGAGQGGAAQGGAGQGGAAQGPVYCGNPSDCGAGLVCAPDGTCKAGDCTKLGCVYGYQCDGPSKTCKAINPLTCASDGDCAAQGAGYACVSGVCTSPSDQCWDQGQCGGEKCAAGKCTAGCTTDADCTGAFKCNVALGICSVPKQPCAITNDCGSASLVCVGGACVGRSNQGACSAPGTVWVENGCLPDQKASFTCQVDGAQDACVAGSICLHHACYICCEQDAAVCANLPSIPDCKSVTTSSGAHMVCGSSQNLGSDCDLTASPPKTCSQGKVCIDGYCK
jgi:hypothetical protein